MNENAAREIACASIRDAGIKHNFENRCPTPETQHSALCDEVTSRVEAMLTAWDVEREAEEILGAARAQGARIGHNAAVILTKLITARRQRSAFGDEAS